MVTNRVAKVVKGGRRFSFTALVVVGDGDGQVGVGYGKAKEIPAAIAKGVEEAKKYMFRVPRIASTIPHPVQGEAAAVVVLLRPASPVPGSSPAARCVPCSNAPASTTCCPSRSARTTRSTSCTRPSTPSSGCSSRSRGRPSWAADRGRRPRGDAAGAGRTGGLTWQISSRSPRSSPPSATSGRLVSRCARWVCARSTRASWSTTTPSTAATSIARRTCCPSRSWRRE